MRRDPVRPPLEPARRDCRQTAALGLGRKACRRIFGAHAAWIAESLVESFSAEPWGSVAGLDRPACVIIGRLVSLPGLRLHARARAGWAAPQVAAIGVAGGGGRCAPRRAADRPPPPRPRVAPHPPLH